MKFKITLFLILASTPVLTYGDDFRKACVEAALQSSPQNLVPSSPTKNIEWITSQLKQLSYNEIWSDGDSLAVDVGIRPLVIGILADARDCNQVALVLSTLQKFKMEGISVEGMAFVFSSSFEGYKKQFKTRFFLKEYILAQEDLNKSTKLVSEWVTLDKNPRKLLEITSFAQSYEKIKSDIRKIVNEEEMSSFKEKLRKIDQVSQKWALDRLYALHTKVKKLEEEKNADSLNQKLADLDVQVKLYDEIRRGLWDKAGQTAAKIKFPSPKLKVEMAKGRQNIENILKVIRGDTEDLEKQIRATFEESKIFVENELKDTPP